MKKILLLPILLSILTLAPSCTQGDVPVSPSVLPAAATQFITQYFPSAEVVVALRSKEWGKTSYEVTLSDGTEIDFDRNGEWDSVECHPGPLPEGIIPAPISSDLRTRFPEAKVLSINKEPLSYELEIAGDVELRYTREGKFLGID